MKNNTYMKIFQVMKDKKWHDKSDFCRPFSADDRRLRDMAENGWIKYESKIVRDGKSVIFSMYRITNIFNSWYEYSKEDKYGHSLIF